MKVLTNKKELQYAIKENPTIIINNLNTGAKTIKVIVTISIASIESVRFLCVIAIMYEFLIV
ncbi:MAG: hypothetical protein ABF289_02940 [Clostridiales bacterium]